MQKICKRDSVRSLLVRASPNNMICNKVADTMIIAIETRLIISCFSNYLVSPHHWGARSGNAGVFKPVVSLEEQGRY